jgi:GMP synthase (glutamine-hydrolysing)
MGLAGLSAAAPRTVLAVLHQAHSTTGRIGRLLKALGYAIDVRRPALGDPLPATLARHAGVIVFGGPMCANDPHDWLQREIEWLEVPLREGAPFLGICLGAQLMARRLGACVNVGEGKRGEIGYYPLNPLPEADALCCEAFPRHVYHWHFDGFDLPAGARRLAQGCERYPNQAFRYGANIVGLQFHPEVTYQMMCRWTVRGAHCLDADGAHPAHEHLEGWRQHDAAVERWLSAFLGVWAGGALQAAAAGFASSPAFAMAAE